MLLNCSFSAIIYYFKFNTTKIMFLCVSSEKIVLKFSLNVEF